MDHCSAHQGYFCLWKEMLYPGYLWKLTNSYFKISLTLTVSADPCSVFYISICSSISYCQCKLWVDTPLLICLISYMSVTCLMSTLTTLLNWEQRWTWVWASSGSWWWTGEPGLLQSVGSQRVGHDWATGQQQQQQQPPSPPVARLWNTVGFSFHQKKKKMFGVLTTK